MEQAMIWFVLRLHASGGKQRVTVLGPVANKNAACYASTSVVMSENSAENMKLLHHLVMEKLPRILQEKNKTYFRRFLKKQKNYGPYPYVFFS